MSRNNKPSTDLTEATQSAPRAATDDPRPTTCARSLSPGQDGTDQKAILPIQTLRRAT
ncbi:hypothetical protein GCM10010191_29990 [Actinomadura vinacea]|uniref:Uncharacterized protein n=1 Tax=Actinomadura vinacea TaxID=115336 RepID=A0ABN3IYA8_9ACTN